jgi:RHS repeat-associated protein
MRRDQDHEFGFGSVCALGAEQPAQYRDFADGSAALVWDAVFQPFGEAYSVSGTATNLLMFPGQFHDSETALAQNWHRDYDATLGRYIESDPIGLSGGINTYAYVGGNPSSRTDFRGLAANSIGWETAIRSRMFGDRGGVAPNGASDFRQISNQNARELLGAANQLLNPLMGIYDCVTGGCGCSDWGLAAAAAIPGFTGLGQASKGIKGATHTIEGFTKHGINDVINRKIKPADVLDAIKNPLKTGAVKYDTFGRPSQRIVGSKAEVVINPVTRDVVSANPTSSSKAARLSQGQP